MNFLNFLKKIWLYHLIENTIVLEYPLIKKRESRQCRRFRQYVTMAVLARLEMAFPTVEYLLNRSLVSSPLEGFASVWMVAPLGEREKSEHFPYI